MSTGKKITIAVIISACVLSLFLPISAIVGKPSPERYECIWSDGSVSEEDHVSAYSSLLGTDGAHVLLEREGKTGRIAMSDRARAIASTLKSGDLAELLSLNGNGLLALEQSAIYRQYANVLYYDREIYFWSGTKLVRSDREIAHTVVLLSGNLPAYLLSNSGAETLVIHAAAKLTPKRIIGSKIVRVEAQAPYFVKNNGIYLSTKGGVRLVAAFPLVTSFTAIEECVFADEAALSPCSNIEELTLPFIGNGKDANATDYVAEFGHFFLQDSNDRFIFPEKLHTLNVTGGSILSHAFHGCESLKVVNTCGVPADRISQTAFECLPQLRQLHTAMRNPVLTFDREERVEECGCTTYTRK